METITVTANSDQVDNSASQAELEGAQTISMVQIALPNQPVQVQSVIQPSQPSVIQATGQTIQHIQVTGVADGELTEEDLDSKKRREILARRPSYRKILNELSSDTPVSITVAKIEEESNSSSEEAAAEEANAAATQLVTNQVVPAQAIQLTAQGDATSQAGIQTLTMTNVNTTSTSNTAGPTIVQYAQGPDGQFFIPAGTVQAYQISTPTSLPQSVVMTGGTTIASPASLSEEASRKRELRLLKNRDAAKECRRKKKEYVKCLENRVAVLENQNKTLIEELKSLKELYCQKDS